MSNTPSNSQAAELASLEHEIKELIISALALEDITAAEIDAQAPLFNEGLGLDSIDALELGLALKNRYGISVASDSEQTRQHFRSVASLAQFVNSHLVQTRAS